MQRVTMEQVTKPSQIPIGYMEKNLHGTFLSGLNLVEPVLIRDRIDQPKERALHLEKLFINDIFPTKVIIYILDSIPSQIQKNYH